MQFLKIGLKNATKYMKEGFKKQTEKFKKKHVGLIEELDNLTDESILEVSSLIVSYLRTIILLD